MKPLAQSGTASVRQHQDLLLGVSVSSFCALFMPSGLCAYSLSACSAVAGTTPGISGDAELRSARAPPSKPPSHITPCAEMVSNTPVPSQQEFPSPSFHRVQAVGPCSLGQSLQ